MRSALKPRLLIPVALAFAAAATAMPASAEVYKWVDENGATHYSDRKPDDQKSANKVKSVDGAVSVYSPDKTLLRAVEKARDKASQPEVAVEPERIARPYMAPVSPQPPLETDPCAATDYGYYYPYAPGYAARRRGQNLNQAVLPPGATAGTVNSPGIIPGNTGTTPTGTAGHPEPPKQSSVSRPGPRHSDPQPEPRFSAR